MKLITLKDIFSQQVDPPAVILVEGASGTLKSGLCFSLMLDLLKDPNRFGLYITLEQSWSSHLVNMDSLGLLPTENLLSADFNIMRKEFRGGETSIRIFDSILEILSSLNQEKEGNLIIFALDSLNAIYSILPQEMIENSLIPFFKKLRQYNVISLIIHEKTGEQPAGIMRERYLADGIISLGIQHQRGEMIRYLQPLKFTFGEHSLKRMHIVAGKDGLTLPGPVYR
jgi:archaellum biogenesis ATPase FlaH